jgi:hypothetical protein
MQLCNSKQLYGYAELREQFVWSRNAGRTLLSTGPCGERAGCNFRGGSCLFSIFRYEGIGYGTGLKAFEEALKSNTPQFIVSCGDPQKGKPVLNRGRKMGTNLGPTGLVSLDQKTSN